MPPNKYAHENPQYAKIREMLIARPAQCLWQVAGPKMHGRHEGTSQLEAWVIGGRPGILIVHIFPEEGVDLYTNDTPSTFEEIEKLLGPTDEERHAALRAAAEVTP